MGGAATRMLNAVKGLQNFDHDVILITAFPHYPNGDIPKDLRLKAFSKNKLGKIEIYRVWVPPLPHKGLARRFITITHRPKANCMNNGFLRMTLANNKEPFIESY